MTRLLLAALVVLVFSACTKNPLDPTTNNQNQTAATPTPNACPSADAVLWAVQSTSTQQSLPNFPPVEINIGLAVGIFTSNGLGASTPTRVSAGTVTANSTDLDYEGETYLNKPDTNDPQGIDWSTGVTWSITGDNGYQAFNHTPTNQFPTVSEITSSAEVNRTSGYTLSCNTVTGADSVLFLVGDVAKTMGPSTTSYTFSASELASLDAGTNFVQIVPYTLSSKVFGSKTICFGKESVRQLMVEIK